MTEQYDVVSSSSNRPLTSLGLLFTFASKTAFSCLALISLLHLIQLVFQHYIQPLFQIH